MFISVIPIAKSQGRTPYTYSVGKIWEEQIVLGGLVEIPFGKDLLTGIVVNTEVPSTMVDASHEIRPIHSVLASTPVLDRENLDAIVGLAQRYFLPIHKALALFLPASLLHRLEKRNYVLTKHPGYLGAPSKFPITLHHYIKQTFSQKDLSTYLHEGTVLIFPDDVLLYLLVGKDKLTKETLFLPNESSLTKRVQSWIDIFEGKYQIIVGTRRLLYYNLSAYKNIVYIEDAFGVEQFQYPISLRSLDVLSLLAESAHHSFTLISSSPTLELFSKFPKAKIVSLS